MNRDLLITLLFLGIAAAGIGLLAGYFREPLQEATSLPTLSSQENESKPVPEKSSEGPSFQSLLERSFDTEALTIGDVLQKTSSYTKYAVTYKSDEYIISGVLYIPSGDAPAGGFPVLITNHGYIDPAIYTTGRGLKREQEYFASRGYVVLHPDYRNHAGSTKTSDDPISDRLGYITDIIHGVVSLTKSSVSLNKENITLLGHSMGGGASLAAAIVKPDIADRVVLYAPVTVNYLDSYLRYQSDDPKRAERVKALYGSPEEKKEFWDGLNGEPFLDRVSVPVQIYHGTNDPDVPYDWSLKTKKLLEEEKKSVELITYEGERHEFSFAWQSFMESVLKFSGR